MKKLIFAFYILFPTLVFSQHVNGIWRGTLRNDSTKQTQKYELALSEYKGDITGYSYTTFIANDSFYYSIKRIKASIKGGELIVQDDEMISNNFPERASKGVKQTTTIQITGDSMTSLTGKWKTNKTRNYYAINGTAKMELDKDSTQSALIAHLDELVKQKELKLSIAEKKQNSPKIKEERIKPVKEEPVKKEIAVKEKKAEPKKETAIAPPVAKVIVEEKKKKEPKQEATVKTETAIVAVIEKKIEPKKETFIPPPVAKVFVEEKKKEEPKKDVAVKAPVSITTVAEKKVEPKKEAVVIPPLAKVTVEEKKKELQKADPEIKEAFLVKPETKPVNNLKEISVAKEAEVVERKTVSGQIINLISDSLLLSFYDNGIVDGDSISVFLNGKVIVDKERLSEKAMKRVIYITNDMPDSLQLVLFAENLGTLPPNTGLVIIRDGTNVYDVRFSADFSKNASITFKRRK